MVCPFSVDLLGSYAKFIIIARSILLGSLPAFLAPASKLGKTTSSNTLGLVTRVNWVRQEKDTLALGNITGAMVFQTCIPVAFGIAFTPVSYTHLRAHETDSY